MTNDINEISFSFPPKPGERIFCDFIGNGSFLDCTLVEVGKTFFKARFTHCGADLTFTCRFVQHKECHAFWRSDVHRTLHYQFTQREE